MEVTLVFRYAEIEINDTLEQNAFNNNEDNNQHKYYHQTQKQQYSQAIDNNMAFACDNNDISNLLNPFGEESVSIDGKYILMYYILTKSYESKLYMLLY